MFGRIFAVKRGKINKNYGDSAYLSTKNAFITTFCRKFAEKFDKSQNDCYLGLTEISHFVKTVKHIINWIVWSLLALYLILIVVVRLPVFQQFIAKQIATAVSDKIGSGVTIGHADLGLLNRIILDDVHILDQQQKEMLRVGRLSARVELLPLSEGKVFISSIQLFGARAKLYQTADKDGARTNFQFVLDSLASKDTTSSTPLNLRINSLIVRRSSVTFDKLDKPQTPGLFNIHHLNVSDISAYVILKALTDDALDVNVKRISLKEQSGLSLSNLSLKLKADKKQASLRDFILEMPSSRLRIDSLDADYQFNDEGFISSSITYLGAIDSSHITPSDLRCFHTSLKNFQRDIQLSTAFSGTHRHLDVPRLSIHSENNDINLDANGQIDGLQEQTPAWKLNISQLALSENTIDFIQKNISQLPPQIKNLGSIWLNGQFGGEKDGSLAAKGTIGTGIGEVGAEFLINGSQQFQGSISTQALDLKQLLDDEQLGTVATDLQLSGLLPKGGKPDIHIEGNIGRFDYNGYSFGNINLDGSYHAGSIAGHFQIDDPNVKAEMDGELAKSDASQIHTVNLNGTVSHLIPKALNLSDKWGDAQFSGQVQANFTARTLNDAVGTLHLTHFSMTESDRPPYHLDNLLLTSGYEEGRHFLTLVCDFAKAELQGDFDYTTLHQSFANMVASKLPTMPGLPPLSDKAKNDFALRMQVYKSDFLQRLLDIDLHISQPVTLSVRVNDQTRTMYLDGEIPHFTYNGGAYTDGLIHLTSPKDTMQCYVNVNKLADNGEPLNLKLNAKAADNKLKTSILWDDGREAQRMSGELNCITELYRNLAQEPEAHMRIQPSHIVLNDTAWNVEPADILYASNNLLVDHFNVHHGKQHITIDGRASKSQHDSLTVDLNEVEVAYILDLVDFHTVEFSGKATGKVRAWSLFNDFGAHANLKVGNFKFENGRMGTLSALADWNKEKEQIDINAIANDGPDAMTTINGYVSPTHNTIDLAIGARGTYVDFMHTYTDAFLDHITGHADGALRLAGTLDNINLTGKLLVEGEAGVTVLNTTYYLHRDTVVFIPDEIELHGLPLTDIYGNRATLSGGIHHKHLTNLTFDLFVNADNLLAYDFKDFGDANFYGTVFASGDVSIKGLPGEVTIDCNVTPQKNTVFVYNASSPDAISSQEFIRWGSVTKQGNQDSPLSTLNSQLADDIRTDIRINFLVNCTPDATMRLLMDDKTDDYINLNGDGTIRATFYNKGAFNMFGTYTVDHGTYGVTIQNIIKKNFIFNKGGTIVFGGDPYNAALNLQAVNTVSGVSLSDLNIGNSFASNTIRVNCLMNISGQPNAPQVDFDLEMPTVNADEQQMIRSIINGQQEMNQQVLYLLAIGRFYTQGQNNSNVQQQDQTSLAMQSLLSGTISAQINTLLNTVIKNDNWNFGANISTGNEGWHNAEYEGLVSGRMLNNRLLLNGQFGYRDNATHATPSFIGDFDIQYLLFPNGNLSLKMYNQTNDRYFTKSSLNTQGLGVIMKKDFNGLRDLFSTKKKKSRKK